MDPTAQALVARLQALLPQVLLADRLDLEARLRDLRPSGEPAKLQAYLRRLLERAEFSHLRWEERAQHRPKVRFPEDLPVSARAGEIEALIKAHPVVVVAGETGSGKTTQLPKICLQAGFGIAGKIACTQPRRVAALSVSRRIAEELQVEWGREVGAKIRFTDRTGSETLVKMLTDGMLLAEIQADPLLTEYEVVIVDEAHERSLNIDFLLGYLHNVRERRPDLRILVTSATIDTAAFAQHFADAPVVEVTGRTYPVEVVYAPVDELLADTGEQTYIEAAAQAVDQVIAENHPGDILIFLPGEKDIRELRELLEGRRLGRVELLPLFGRLSNAEQQRIFAPTQARKIILATNIAETSITVPGIRYVIDTGLARVSRFSAATRTLRLPIEPIAQSSADQRKGRAGRVGPGVCIRLYSEQDFLSRPRYATPEILRANLAAVILRMIAFQIGEVETFPFLDPPTPRAIHAGYQLLQDLGALDAERRLTPLGREIAHLPCDPTVGRMLLAARQEGCVREVLVIAAALSIQDPRERPLDQQAAADEMHRKFVHPESDFLTLLNIWDAYHDETERLSQAQLRRFCTSHFLSYLRMREWRDIHQQLEQVLRELGEVAVNSLSAEYHQVHRALLTGLLANIAEREEGNHYKATHNRRVMLFPGSALFDKKSAKAERQKFKGQQKPSTVSGHRTPPWVMCAEWMETGRLYARTVAKIEPTWVLELGPHLCKSSYTEPYYQEEGERVLVRERVRVYGLEVAVKRVGYTRLNPQEATEIFIREALVDGKLRTQLPFFVHNQALRAKVEDLQTRLRRPGAWSLDERVYAFYAARLQGVGSMAELRRFLKDHHGGADAVLHLREEDLIGPEELTGTEAFPDAVAVDGLEVPLHYTYQPGQEVDGATLRVPVQAFGRVPADLLDWVVPGYVAERVETLLRSLPKEKRVRLFPLGDKARELATDLRPTGSFAQVLVEQIRKRYGVELRPQDFDWSEVPNHLRPRLELVDQEGRLIAAGRDFAAVQAQYEAAVRAAPMPDEDDARGRVWTEARARLEKHELSGWSFPDFPRELTIGEVAGLPVVAYPALRVEAAAVGLYLAGSAAEAAQTTPAGFQRLAEQALAKDLAWLEKDLRKELARVRLAAIDLLSPPELEAQSLRCLQEYLFAVPEPLPLRKATFEAVLVQAKERARGVVQKWVDLLDKVLRLRQEVRAEKAYFPELEAELARLVPPDFILQAGPDRLPHLPRYLEALKRRNQKARTDLAKDQKKAAQVAPFARALAHWQGPAPAQRQFRWLLEEYRVQVFAQELGTADKVSDKRLNELLGR